MKLVILGNIAPSLVRFRGALIRAAIEHGAQVVGCAPDNEEWRSAGVADILADWGARFRSVQIDRAGMNPTADLLTIATIFRLLRSEQPDVFLPYTMKPVIFGSLAARLTHVPRVVPLITGLGYVFSEGPEFRRKLARKVVLSLLRLSLADAACIIFQNRDDLLFFQANRLISQGTDTMVVAGSGVDLSEFQFAPPVVSPVTFILISRLIRDKGVAEFAAALKILRERYSVQGTLVGPIDPNPAGISLAEIQGWADSGVLNYVGGVADVRPYLRASSVFVLPTWYREGVPRTIIEALAMGRPVITTDTPGCRDTVIPGQNGFFVIPRDISSLSEAMEKFIVSPDTIATMGAHSRALAESKFDVRKVNIDILRALMLD